VTGSVMDYGSVSEERPKRPPGRRRLLFFLPAGCCGSPGSRGAAVRRGLSLLPGGLGALRTRARAAGGGASRASPLLLLLLVPSPRLAAAAPRRPLTDWERSRPGLAVPAAGRCGAWRSASGFAGAAGTLHLGRGPAAALASCRRGEGRDGGAGGTRGRVSRGHRAPPAQGWNPGLVASAEPRLEVPATRWLPSRFNNRLERGACPAPVFTLLQVWSVGSVAPLEKGGACRRRAALGSRGIALQFDCKLNIQGPLARILCLALFYNIFSLCSFI
jgi:hypothetical protein